MVTACPLLVCVGKASLAAQCLQVKQSPSMVTRQSSHLDRLHHPRQLQVRMSAVLCIITMHMSLLHPVLSIVLSALCMRAWQMRTSLAHPKYLCEADLHQRVQMFCRRLAHKAGRAHPEGFVPGAFAHCRCGGTVVSSVGDAKGIAQALQTASAPRRLVSPLSALSSSILPTVGAQHVLAQYPPA